MLERAASGCRAEHAAAVRRRRDRLRGGRGLGLGAGRSATVMSAMSRVVFSGRVRARRRTSSPRRAVSSTRVRTSGFRRLGELSLGSLVTVTGFRRDARHALRAAVDRRGDDFRAFAAGRRVFRRLCRGRRDTADDALSLGRLDRLRHRLLRPGAACDAHGRAKRAARFRHAGRDYRRADRAGRGLFGPSARRPRLLEGPCRDHDRRDGP